MTLQETAQILGGVGVIVSIVYVGIQIRNNARATRAATYHQVSNTFITYWDSLSRDFETLSVMLRGSEDFGGLEGQIEQSRFYLNLMASMRRFENAWFQYKVGVLKESDWNAIAFDLDSVFTYPGVRFAWDGIKNRSSADFRTYVDEVSKRCAAAGQAPFKPS